MINFALDMAFPQPSLLASNGARTQVIDERLDTELVTSISKAHHCRKSMHSRKK